MFKKTVPLKHSEHASLRILDTNDYDFARGEVMAPIVLGELGDCAREYPIIFPSNGTTLPHVLLGLDAAKNSYVGSNGHWQAEYIPASIRRYPVALAEAGDKDEHGNQKYVVVIDAASSLVGDPHGFPVFDASGQLSDYMRQRVRQVENLQKQSTATQSAVRSLEKAGLLVERKLTIKRGNEAPRILGGMRVVDETALNKLTSEKLIELLACGGLALAYAHLISWANLRRGPLSQSKSVTVEGAQHDGGLIDFRLLS